MNCKTCGQPILLDELYHELNGGEVNHHLAVDCVAGMNALLAEERKKAEQMDLALRKDWESGDYECSFEEFCSYYKGSHLDEHQ